MPDRGRNRASLCVVATCLGLCGALITVGCGQTELDRARISWTGAPAPMDKFITDYILGINVEPDFRAQLFKPKYYSPPEPFYSFPNNEDAMTLALSARVGESFPAEDVFYTDLYWFRSFEPEWLESCEELTVPIDGQPRVLREIIPVDLASACELSGELYAVPFSIRGNCLYYRKDLVANPPKTWPELIAIARDVLHSGSPDVPNLGLSFHWKELHTDLYPVLWGYGGGIPTCLTPSGDLNTRLESDQNLAALAMFFDLMHGDDPAAQQRLCLPWDELTSRTAEDEKRLFEEFASGRTLFAIDWSNRASRIAEQLNQTQARGFSAHNIGVAPIPHGPDTSHSFAVVGSWGWALAANPRSPHSRDFIRQMASPDTQLHFFIKHAEVPIYRQSVLEQLAEWPATRRRLTDFHVSLLDLLHGAGTRSGVVLRDRPRFKEVNRLIAEALQRALAPRADGNETPQFDANRAREHLKLADERILAYLRRLHDLKIDCSCDPRDPASVPAPAVAPPAVTPADTAPRTE
ncbi:MAG: extracellular solute-binding protein [Pirellulales bacterium]